MIDLKNCPFCGSSVVGGAGGQIHCYSCPARIEVQNTNTHYAAELWNKRAYNAEITRLHSEVERLRGRLCKTCEGTGMIGGPSSSAPDEGGDPCPECNAWLLRKQAEAVDEFGNAFDRLHRVVSSRKVAEDASDYAQRLRQQAAELERQ